MSEEITRQPATSSVPQTDILAPSPSTEESVTAYNERILMILGEEEEEFDVPLLPSQTSPTEDKPSEQKAGREYVSNVMEKVIDIQVRKAQESKATAEDHEISSEVSSSVRKDDYFQTDTIDFEEKLDSSDAEPTKEQPVLIPADFEIIVEGEGDPCLSSLDVFLLSLHLGLQVLLGQFLHPRRILIQN